MERMNMKNGTAKIVVASLIACLAMATQAICDTQVALMLKQTPANGGSINIGTGVHQYAPGSKVTVTATPRPGYQFVYWLGDVSDSTASTTVASVDSPKIIVAVFERVEYDFPAFEQMTRGRSGGGAMRKPADYYTGAPSAPGVKRPSKFSWPSFPSEEQENGDLPVPDDGGSGDLPVPERVPEPATVAMLGLGALFARMRRQG